MFATLEPVADETRFICVQVLATHLLTRAVTTRLRQTSTKTGYAQTRLVRINRNHSNTPNQSRT